MDDVDKLPPFDAGEAPRRSTSSLDAALAVFMTFSILAWQCPNIRGENSMLGVFLIALGLFALFVSIHKDARVGAALSRNSPRYPARLHHRIIFGIVGVASGYTGLKVVLLCH
jgi:hypothetical protein